MKYIKLFILTILLFTSCTKEIEIDMGEFVQRPVIEGYIENGTYPWVILTYNQEFFSELNLDFTTVDGLQTIIDLFIQDAEVIVSDGKISDTLALMIEPGVMNGEYVWPPVKYQGSKIIGEVGGKYDLTVEIDDIIYTSTTTITEPFIPDSQWVVYDKEDPNYCWIHLLISDDPDEANYYNCFAKRLGRDNYFAECGICLWDDKYFNGKEFEITVYRGSSLFSMDTIDQGTNRALKFYKDDTVQLKIVTMDNSSFSYWLSLQNSSVVHTNIIGGAIGVWCGYGVYYPEPIICKREEREKKEDF